MKSTKKIYFIRGHRTMLDSDLAFLYGVETKERTRAVRRNLDRFPYGFLFQINDKEFEILRCQIGASKSKERRGGRRYLPLVFTEQGVAMLSMEGNRNLAKALSELEMKEI